MMRLRCECGRTLGYEPHQAGKKVRCPGCERMLVVPDEEIDEVEAVEEPPTRARKADAAPVRFRDDDPEPAPRPRRGRDRDEPEYEDEAVEERPRRKRRVAREEPATGFMHTVGALLYTGPGATVMCVMGAIGIGLFVYGFSEGKLGTGATDKPQTISCQQLISAGMPANPHVLVTDAIPGNNYVYRVKVTKSEQASGNTAGKPWEGVYVPLLPLTADIKTRWARGEQFAPPPPGNQIRLILYSTRAKNPTELGNLFSQGTIQGMIINSISSLDTKTKDQLLMGYPGVKLDQVLILEAGRKPTSRAFVMTMIACGTVLVVLAVLMASVAIVFRPRE